MAFLHFFKVKMLKKSLQKFKKSLVQHALKLFLGYVISGTTKKQILVTLVTSLYQDILQKVVFPTEF